METIKNLLPKSQFFENVVTLLTGTVIAQAIPILISPILTRIYTATEFGIFAIFQSIIAVLGIIVTGRYELAIVLPKKENAAANLLILAVLITLVMSGFVAAFLLLFGSQIITQFEIQALANWLYCIPITLLFLGFFQIFSYWHNRQGQFKILSIGKALKGVFNALGSVVFGFFNATAGSLISSLIISQGIALFYLQKKIAFTREIKPYYSSRAVKEIAVRYKDFPTVNLIHSGVNVLKDNIVNILIAVQYTASALGFYYLVLRAMKMPASLIGYSISQVFLKEASDRYQKTGDISVLVFSLIKRLVSISFIPLLFSLFFIEDIFSLVFGAEWVAAGQYAKALSIYIFFHFIASPLGMIPIVVEKQKAAFWWGLTESILFVCSYLIGYYWFADLYKTLLLLSISMAGYFIVYFSWIYKISKGSAK